MKPVITCEHVFLRYQDVVALEDVSLTVNPLDFLAVLGPNGGGKTSLIKLILGLEQPVSGTVRVFGARPQTQRTKMGYVAQYMAFDRRFPVSVWDVALMGRLGPKGLFKRYSSFDRELVRHALNQVGMYDFKDRQIGALSGGQLQRVLIARALCGEPEILILDEPSTSLDQQIQNSLYSLLHQLNQAMTIVLVTHDMALVSAYVKQIACLNRRLFLHGAPKDVTHSHIQQTYGCPFEFLAHGLPHRVLGPHAHVSTINGVN